jgi:hypothetical protein
VTNVELKQKRVRIVNRDHPHYRETGFLTGEVVVMFWGTKMAKLALENCRHGTDACFISLGDIEIDRLQG